MNLRERSSTAAHWATSRPTLISWLTSTAFWTIYIEYQNHFGAIRRQGVVFDEFGYTLVSDLFTGPWTLTGYTNGLRGVAFPWVIRQLQPVESIFGNGMRGRAALIAIVCVPILLGIIVPSIVRSLTGRRPTLVRVAALNLLFFLFWRNDALRLLSDIPALCAMAGAVALLLRSSIRSTPAPTRATSTETGGIPDSDDPRDKRNGDRPLASVLVPGVAAGVLMGLAVNTRPAYLLPTAGAVVAVALLGARPAVLGLRIGGLVLGMAVALTPQMIVNSAQGAGLTPLPSKSGELASMQLRVGLEYQRYDTYVGNSTDYPAGGMVFDNRPNLAGLDTSDVTSYGAFARAFLTHPGAVLGSTARHAFNGLDLQQPGTYVEDVRSTRVPFQIANFLTIFTALAVLMIRAVRRFAQDGRSAWRHLLRDADGRRSLWTGVPLALVAVQASLSAVETRFMMPVHLALLAVLALSAGPSDLPRKPRTRVVMVAAILVLVGLALAASATVSDSLTPPVPG